jgi:hypothetical protein
MNQEPGEIEKNEKNEMLQYQSLRSERNLGYVYQRWVLKIPYFYLP